MSACDRLHEIANARDAERHAAAIAAAPEYIRAEAFATPADGSVIFRGHYVGAWNGAGFHRDPCRHPCFATLARFTNQRFQSDSETLAMIRSEFEAIIEWCMKEPPPKTFWQRIFK